MDDGQIKKNLCISIPKISENENAGGQEREFFRESPIQKPSDAEYESKKPIQLQPGTRSDIARDFGGFTAMLVNQSEKSKSHLFGLGEYCAMYLLVWSPILWCARFPKGKDICPNYKQAKVWDKEVVELEGFARNLWRVRRALANIPTYMICDDHDVSDDFYLNREWCYRVLGATAGSAGGAECFAGLCCVSGLGKYAAQFDREKPGDKLLKAAEKWSASAGTDVSVWEKAASYLGIPRLDPKTNLPKLKLDEDVFILDRDCEGVSEVLNWHFTVRSFKHEVIVLDTRTWRGYPVESPIEAARCF